MILTLAPGCQEIAFRPRCFGQTAFKSMGQSLMIWPWPSTLTNSASGTKTDYLKQWVAQSHLMLPAHLIATMVRHGKSILRIRRLVYCECEQDIQARELAAFWIIRLGQPRIWDFFMKLIDPTCHWRSVNVWASTKQQPTKSRGIQVWSHRTRSGK